MTPYLATTTAALREAMARARRAGLSVGLVPTMGALHAGHVSLLQAARAETQCVVVSLFVNPTQFGPREDFSRYPRPFEEDCRICAQEKVDVLFAPSAEEMYPPGFRTYVEVQGMQEVLCGASRPGHFRGVATVVLKLFHLVQPDVAYFGRKDAQQARLIQQMVQDLAVPVRVRVCPIVREADGLALSSRNQYLTPEQRRQAPVLYQALTEARALVERGERDASAVRQALASRIARAPAAVIDYVAVVDADTLLPLTRLRGDVLLAVAVKFGATRLIDNELLSGIQ